MKELYLKHALFTALFLLVSITSYADSNVTIDGIIYTLDKGTATVAQNSGIKGAIVIPEKVSYSGMNYSVTSIGDYAFENCTELTSISIPNSLTSIGQCAFHNCIKIKSLTIPHSVTSVGVNAFFNSGLIDVTIHSNDAIACFNGALNLETVTLGDEISTINDYSFDDCDQLKSIIIPKSVTSIGNYAFRACSRLAQITTYISDPSKTTNSSAFEGVNKQTCIIFVPKGTIPLYSAADGWKDFSNFLEIGGTVNKCETPTISYKDGKLVFNCSTAGAEYHYTITDADVTTNTTTANELQLTGAYEIAVYAGAAGLDFSETAKATLYWIEGAGTSSITKPATRALIAHVSGSTITLSGLNDNESASFYTTGGMLIGKAASAGGEATFNTGLNNQVIIVKIGNRSIEVAVK